MLGGFIRKEPLDSKKLRETPKLVDLFSHALENEMLLRIKHQGLDIKPEIIVVTRLIPEAYGTTCNQRIERIGGTQHSRILRVPFRTEKGVLQKWVSRFDVWPYLERFSEVKTDDLSRLKLLIFSVCLQCFCTYPF